VEAATYPCGAGVDTAVIYACKHSAAVSSGILAV